MVDEGEIHRVANSLGLAKVLLEGDLLLNLVTHPLRNAVIELQLLDLINQVDCLQRDLLVVAQNLFGIETTITQNHRFLMADLTKAAAQVASNAFSLVGTTATLTGVETYSTYSRNTLSDLAIKLEATYQGANPRVRIDLNQSNGWRQFTVYIPGIQNIGLSNNNPFDIASSVAEFTGKPNSAEQAVLLAMKQSGIGEVPGDHVLFVGHSLGGMIAANLARSNQYQVSGVITFGSPNDQIDVPKHIPQLNLVHYEDSVTTLDGISYSGQKADSEVQFDYLSNTPGTDSNQPGWSHNLKSYEQTAKQLDAENNPQFEKIRQMLQTTAGDGSIASRYYSVSR